METFSVNKQGGTFRCGGYYSLEKKVSVMETYHRLAREAPNNSPSIVSVAKEAKVSWDYAKKVILEIQDHGTIIPPSILKSQRKVVSGVGAVMKLTQEQEAYLLALQITNPGRTNDKYVEEFHKQFHTHISRSFVLQFFKSKYEYSGKFVMPNLVRLDKFCPVNIAQYVQF